MINSNIMPHRYNPYTVTATAVLFLGAMSILGWFGYSYYKSKIEESAYKDFAELVNDYQKKSHSKEKQTLIDLERAFATGAQRHSNSKLYPFFLTYQAEALTNLGKTKEALEVLNTALNKMDKSNPLYFTYATKRALIKYDIPELKASGKEELENLAKDKNNPLQDMAIYYLGLFEYNQNRKDMAKNLWQDIVNKNNQESGWFHLAKTKLEGLSNGSSS